MKILFLEQQPCIRALKYALGLKSLGGYHLAFAYSGKTLEELYGSGNELFEEWIHVSLEGNELESLLLSHKFDLIHSHNAPDFLTVKALQIVRKHNLRIPVIHDNHDVITMRNTIYSTHPTFDQEGAIKAEKIANLESDARIFVTQGVADYVINKYPVVDSVDLVFNNYVPQGLLPQIELPKLSEKDGQVHVVYEGTLDIGRTDGHYDLYEIFKQIADLGIHIHIYSPRNPELTESYKELEQYSAYCHFHGKRGSKDLLQLMTQYDFGLAAFNDKKNREHLDVVLANKVMEYIASGIPVISFPHKEQKDFLEKYNLGIIINTLSDLKNINENYDIESIKKSIEEMKNSFTIEKNILVVEKFYQKVNDRKQK